MVGVGGQQDLRRAGGGDESRGDVDRIAQDTKLGPFGGANHADDQRSGGGANADLEPVAPIRRAAPIQGLVRADRAERGGQGALAVIAK